MLIITHCNLSISHISQLFSFTFESYLAQSGANIEQSHKACGTLVYHRPRGILQQKWAMWIRVNFLLFCFLEAIGKINNVAHSVKTLNLHITTLKGTLSHHSPHRQHFEHPWAFISSSNPPPPLHPPSTPVKYKRKLKYG